MNFFLFAGEPSGDLHGSHLLKRLSEEMPTAHFTGVGGPKMQEAGLEAILTMEDFAVMGFSDVLMSLPRIIRQFRYVSRTIMQRRPEAVILIDYPDFNLRLAKDLRKRGYQGKIIQYVSPTVWAWRKQRITIMEKNLDLLLTIYPFEENFYKGSSLPVTFVGNPLTEYLRNYNYDEKWKEHLGLPSDHPIIALFPGSRTQEIAHNLPLQLQAVNLLLKQTEGKRTIAISCSDPKHAFTLMQEADRQGLTPAHKLHLIPPQYTYELMKGSHVALAKSGTVTLELALHSCPTVVLYKLSTFNYVVAKYLMRLNLPHYCMVNILLQKESFPECIERNVNAHEIFTRLSKMDSQESARLATLSDCNHLKSILQNEQATSKRAADAILTELSE